MKTVPLIKRLGAAALAAVMTVSALAVGVGADEPYYGYNYDWWMDPVPSQNGYIVDKVLTGYDLGVGSFSTLSDIFVDEETGKIYLTDSDNARIIVTDSTFAPSATTVIDTFNYSSEFPESKSSVKSTKLNKPSGCFVTHYKGKTLIYIADAANSRVVACYEDGSIWMEYTKPSSDLYDSNVTFNPKNIAVDNALNVYVVITSITQGMVQFSQDGSFNGYYGANRVQQTSQVLANAFWKLIMTREQMQKMIRNVAVEIGNVDIDDEGFIYTVTGTKSSQTDILKKLNPAGDNVYTNMGYDDYLYGDPTVYFDGTNYASLIEDVEVDENKNVFLLDFSQGRIFQYSDELDLEFIFGGTGNQKGLFTSPSAIETLGGRVYVTDGRKNSITIFKKTEFGELVQTAIALYNRGLYEEAKVPFQEIMLRDSNYWFAYIGIGNAYYTEGDYENAMKYFYMNTRGGYNRAFKSYRIEFVRANFNYFMIAVLVIIAGLVALSVVRKRIKKKKAGGNK